MLIGTTTIVSNENPFGIDFELTTKAGFNTIDYQKFQNSNNEVYLMNSKQFKEHFSLLKKELDKYNLSINQMHGYWEYKNYEYDSRENWPILKRLISRNMEAAKILGCKYIVLHPRFPFGALDKDLPPEEGFKLNLDFLKYILPTARKYNITLCIENLPRRIKYCDVNGILEMVKVINDRHIKMCLDTGHANVTEDESMGEVVKKIGKHLKVIHVHDNPGDADRHLLPGEGTINWKDFMKALKEINFKGSFSFETQSKNDDKKIFLKEEKDLVSFARKLMKI